MALIVRVSINDKVNTAVLAAVRIAGGDDLDSMNTYEVGAWHVPLDGDGSTFVPIWPEGEQPSVEHRYGDGSLELVKKIVAALP